MILNKIKNKYDQKDGSLYGEKNIKDSLAMLYHENSKFTEYTFREQGAKIGAFNTPYVIERSSQPFKCYPGYDTIDLNVYRNMEKESVNYFELLQNRRSVRNYDKDYKISLYEIHNLLFRSYGVNRKERISGIDYEGHIGYRNIPSGGGLYPLEIYIVVLNGHIDKGLYHYRPDMNCLEILKHSDDVDHLNNIIQAEPYIDLKAASCVIMTTGLIERSMIKYGDRGYRFLMMEVGFLSQTISLISTSLNLGSCMVGGYNDDLINQYLGIDGVFETVNNIIVIGKENE